MDELLAIIGRKNELFIDDLLKFEEKISEIIQKSTFLVLGGAGSIGQAVTKEIFTRSPLKLHVVDISENNLVELVRDIRSEIGYIEGEFKTFALDIGSREFEVLYRNNFDYDYVLNLSALKHVRSEKDPYTLMRMIDVNIFNTLKTIRLATESRTKKYFCVSTDKAANPVNLMGASKRIMEMFLMRESGNIEISMARFANVAFSDGSLLHGFDQRIKKRQPIVAPNDVRRYFVTPKESGLLCLISCLLGQNRDIFFPKLNDDLHLTTFSEIAVKYLSSKGFKPHECESEEAARSLSDILPKSGHWPCIFSKSDTTGEKDFEEFYTSTEIVDFQRFPTIGVIKNDALFDENLLNWFVDTVESMRQESDWEKQKIVSVFNKMLPNFQHIELGKYLETKM